MILCDTDIARVILRLPLDGDVTDKAEGDEESESMEGRSWLFERPNPSGVSRLVVVVVDEFELSDDG